MSKQLYLESLDDGQEQTCRGCGTREQFDFGFCEICLAELERDVAILHCEQEEPDLDGMERDWIAGRIDLDYPTAA